uniref:Putative secreted protein n=1 Tax=Anopheles triannulatus TaxID=58253 RepID=A0A2M4B1P1_9DIPT
MASVLWCSRWIPSRMTAWPARAAASRGESCHTVSPFGRVVRFCSRSRAVISWYRTIVSVCCRSSARHSCWASTDLPQPRGPTRHTSATAIVCSRSASSPA